MSLIILLGTFVVLMLLGTPVAITMFGASLAFILAEPSLSVANVASKVVAGVTSSSLLALPLFIMAGEIMNSSGITKRLFEFPLAFVGHIKGGLAHVNVLASMLFAGMSGSAIADTAGLGKIEMQIMTEEGYDRPFSAAITAASSTIGPIIPPSTTMIVYAVAAEVSVAKLFLGGIVPGVLMGLLLMLYIAVMARKKNFPTRPKAPWHRRWNAFKAALFPVLTPVIIIIGITTGVMTATEAGAVAVIYALLLDICYNGFSWPSLRENIRNSFVTMAQICFIVIASSLFGWVVTLARLPSLVATTLLSMGVEKWLILLLINLIMLLLGCFLSINASLLIMTPMLVTLAQMYHIDLVHLGVMVTLNLTIGLLTPPVGWNLYIMCGVAKISYEDMVKATLPMLIPLLGSLLIITYFDQAVLWLPNLLTAIR